MSYASETTPLTRASLEAEGIFYVDHAGCKLGDKDFFTKLFERLRTYFDSELPLAAFPEYKQPIEPPPYNGQFLPNQIEWLSELLLDCRRVIPTYAVKILNRTERASKPAHLNAIVFKDEDHAFRSNLERDFVEQQYRELMREARDVARKAGHLREDKATEHEWQHFMEREIFKRYEDSKASPYNLSSTCRPLDSYRTSCNIQWNNPSIYSCSQKTEGRLPDPKPDLYLGFEITRQGQLTATGLERSALASNFSLDKLSALSARGLTCSPTNFLSKQRITPTPVDEFRKKDLIAFPFTIVELKHDSVGASEQNFCTFQAANAASRALTMLENLYRHAGRHPSDHHLPPVVTFTCIGSSIRISIAYSFRAITGKIAHIMVCIKKVEISSIWAVLEIHAIVQNLLQWATRVLRPNISAQISRWRLRKNSAADGDSMFVERGREGSRTPQLQDEGVTADTNRPPAPDYLQLLEDRERLFERTSNSEDKITVLEGTVKRLRKELDRQTDETLTRRSRVRSKGQSNGYFTSSSDADSRSPSGKRPASASEADTSPRQQKRSRRMFRIMANMTCEENVIPAHEQTLPRPGGQRRQ
ncbi:hypothetical protein HII31_07079 [Pseudocercospora fuligena]|uniref:Uncharacterized protein n=1 Tax=Pseudocercospora fuligena TaxID=685502 RepID=A0A8H6VID1_9PEZI|nr:hypothetical protein HII31_07079 [Pseudocercospora fuligena]